MMTTLWSGELDVVEHFFELLDENSSTLVPGAWGPSGLMQTNSWGVTVTTGVWGGPVHVTVELLSKSGVSLPDLEVFDLGTLAIESDYLVLQSGDERKRVDLPAGTSGKFAVRMNARCREAAPDEIVETAVEFYRLDLSSVQS